MSILQCVARQTGVRAWFKQITSQGNENTVVMVSDRLSAESEYSKIELECLSVKSAEVR